MTRPVTDYVCAFLGIAVGVVCMLATQSATKEWMDPIVATCTQGEATHFERMLNDGIVPYNPSLGGGFVCLITQFLNALQDAISGRIIDVGWCHACLVSLFRGELLSKQDDMVPRDPCGTVSSWDCWHKCWECVSSCLPFGFLRLCLVGSRDGPFHPQRPMAGVYTSIPATLLAIGIFALDPTSCRMEKLCRHLGRTACGTVATSVLSITHAH